MITRLVALGQTPRFHGNGFVQLYLGPNTRLHVWVPALPRIPGHNAAIHDHVYSMQSRVLLGTMIQCTYEICDRPSDADAEWMDIHRLSPEARRDPRGEPGFDMVGRLPIRETGRLQIGEGLLYSQARDTLHDSEPGLGGPTATLFRRLPRPDDERNARVCCPVGETPMNAFAPEHQPDEMQLWTAIGLAVQLMRPLALRQIEEALDEC